MARVSSENKKERFEFINQHGIELGVGYLCKWLDVSPSGFYKWRERDLSQRDRANQSLLEKIKRVYYESNRAYGSPRVHAQLCREGETASRGRIERLMAKAGLVGRAAIVYRRKPLTKPHYKSLPNLRLEKPMPTRINQQWVADVTYLKVDGQWRYLAVVMDLYSRRIIGWKLDKHRTADVTLAVLKKAVSDRDVRPGLIFHTDQGVEYRAWLILDELKEHGILSSMNRTDSVTDNAHMESFFRSMKAEVIKGVEFKTEEKLRRVLSNYIDGFYNTKRLHSGLGYKIPIECDKMAA